MKIEFLIVLKTRQSYSCFSFVLQPPKRQRDVFINSKKMFNNKITSQNNNIKL